MVSDIRDVACAGARVTGDCESQSIGCHEPNPGPLPRACMLLTGESPLCPDKSFVFVFVFFTKANHA